MASAEDLRAEFTAYMREKGIRYSIEDEADNIVKLSFTGRTDKGGGADTDIFVDFDEDGDEADSVHFTAWDFAHCTQENFAEVLVKLNGYNGRYRWVKFWIRETPNGGAITADMDAVLIPGSSAEEVTRSAFRMSGIVEDVILDLGDLVIRNLSMEDILALLNRLSERSDK